MQIDNKLALDDTNTAADHRVRATQDNNRGPQAASPGTPTERTVAGGPTPVSRPQQDRTRDATDGEPQSPNEPPEPDNRSRAEQELERALRLPANTRIEIEVDFEEERVRIKIRDRATGELVREVPLDETQRLLEKLREFSGVLIDRAF